MFLYTFKVFFFWFFPTLENIDGTKNNDVEGNADARAVPPGAQVLNLNLYKFLVVANI